MDAEFYYDPKQLAALHLAIQRNPKTVLSETGKFFTRGIREYNKYIIRSPWRMGGSGGGAPVATGHLRDTHARDIRPWDARIYPTAKYAPYVHGIEGYPRKRKYQLRPWLDYARNSAQSAVEALSNDLLYNVTKDLAK